MQSIIDNRQPGVQDTGATVEAAAIAKSATSDEPEFRILVVDDNPGVLESFRKILAWEEEASSQFERLKAQLFHDAGNTSSVNEQGPRFMVDTTDQPLSAPHMIKAALDTDKPYAAAIVDMRMPDCDGVTTIERLWDIDKSLQIVICTAFSDHAWRDVSRRLGCSDQWLVLKKPFDTIEVRQIAIALGIKWQLQRSQALQLNHLEHQVERTSHQLRHARKELEFRVNYDEQTRLPNRKYFIERLRSALVANVDGACDLAVLAIRFDRLREIRETLGDPCAAKILLEAAQRVRSAVRASDTVAQITGEEFAVLVSNLGTHEDIRDVARRICEALVPTYHLENTELTLEHAVGISLCPVGSRDADLGLRQALTAALSIGRAHGERFEVFSSAVQQAVLARLAIEGEMRQALRQSQFVLHYQPKVSLQTGFMTGAEALIRWQHPERGLVMPGEFIAVAEQSEIICAIGEWVVNAACAQIARWVEADVSPVPIAINVSVQQLKGRQFEHALRAALARYGIDPKWLELEITESGLGESVEASSALLTSLRQTGVHLALDDFGTGFSSLSYLQHFPVDAVKIDRSFVANTVASPCDAAICRSVIDLAHALKLRVTGEGAENEGQMQFLRRHHCDDVQGFYFSPPLEAAAFEAMLKRQHTFILPDFESGQERTLLLVDDEQFILTALRRLFDQEGIKVLTANSAHEALELLATHQVHVVLTDQRMPAMSGTELLERVRALYPQTVRMILSGYSELSTVLDAINRGTLFKFLLKPWDNDALLRHVQEAFVYGEAMSQVMVAGRGALGNVHTQGEMQ